MNWIDTAPVYGLGRSEELMAGAPGSFVFRRRGDRRDRERALLTRRARTIVRNVFQFHSSIDILHHAYPADRSSASGLACCHGSVQLWQIPRISTRGIKDQQPRSGNMHHRTYTTQPIASSTSTDSVFSRPSHQRPLGPREAETPAVASPRHSPQLLHHDFGTIDVAPQRMSSGEGKPQQYTTDREGLQANTAIPVSSAPIQRKLDPEAFAHIAHHGNIGEAIANYNTAVEAKHSNPGIFLKAAARQLHKNRRAIQSTLGASSFGEYYGMIQQESKSLPEATAERRKEDHKKIDFGKDKDTSMDNWYGNHSELAGSHHKFPKRSLGWINANMTDSQKQSRNKALYLDKDTGANALARLRSNLIPWGKNQVASDTRRDDPEHTKESVDTITTASGKVSPRSRSLSDLAYTYDWVRKRMQESSMSKMTDLHADMLTSHLREAEESHYAIEKEPRKPADYGTDFWQQESAQDIRKWRKGHPPDTKYLGKKRDPHAYAKAKEQEKKDERQKAAEERERQSAMARTPHYGLARFAGHSERLMAMGNPPEPKEGTRAWAAKYSRNQLEADIMSEWNQQHMKQHGHDLVFTDKIIKNIRSEAEKRRPAYEESRKKAYEEWLAQKQGSISK